MASNAGTPALDNNGADNNNNNVNNNGTTLIINELLTFIISVIHSTASAVKLVELVCKYYDIEEIKRAKCLLCDVVKEKYENRNDSIRRSEKNAHATDIIEILKKCDQTNTIPTFVVDGFSLAKIPRIHTEDINYITVAEQIAEMKAQMSLMNDSIAVNTTRSSSNVHKISELMKVKEPSLIDWPPFKPPQLSRSSGARNIPSDLSSMVHGKTKAVHNASHTSMLNSGMTILSARSEPSYASAISSLPASRAESGAAHTQLVTSINTLLPASSIQNVQSSMSNMTSTSVTNSSLQNAPNVQARMPSMNINNQPSGSNITMNNSTEEHGPSDDYRYTSEQMRRQVRRNRGICGTGASARIRGAPRPKWHMFVYKVTPDTDDDEMKQYIELLSVNILDLVRVSHDESVYKSYKLTVYPEDYKKLYSPNVWPDGVCVKRYNSHVPAEDTESRDTSE